MLISTVIITLREVLEAAILFSVLFRVSAILNVSKSWFFPAFLCGLLGAIYYALNLSWISDSFEGVGQEVVNASIQFMIYILIVFYILGVLWIYYFQSAKKNNHWQLILLMSIIAVLLVSREGSEILLYFFSIIAHTQQAMPIIMGMMIGASIGISIGFLFYYSLKALKSSHSLFISLWLLIFVAAGMISQASALMIQADWLNAGLPLWNSSAWLSERSTTGQLFYALLGYEATPSKIQVILYMSALILPLLLILFLTFWHQKMISKHV